jgi:indole-3-glycerol phosphate synthase
MSPAIADVLERILGETRREVERRKREIPLDRDSPSARAREREHRFRDALLAPGIGVIAEFKRRSPSAGTLRHGADLATLVGAYRDGGAAALSILTEGPNFCARRARCAICRCCARTSSSTPTSCRRPRRPEPTRCC